MVETNSSMFSLFEIFKEMTKSVGMQEDIDFWFSVLNTCIVVCLLFYYLIIANYEFVCVHFRQRKLAH